MWRCCTQSLDDLCIFERADSQLDAWAFTENLRMPMKVRVHICAIVHACAHARACQSAECVFHFEGQGIMVKEPVCSSAD